MHAGIIYSSLYNSWPSPTGFSASATIGLLIQPIACLWERLLMWLRRSYGQCHALPSYKQLGCQLSDSVTHVAVSQICCLLLDLPGGNIVGQGSTGTSEQRNTTHIISVIHELHRVQFLTVHFLPFLQCCKRTMRNPTQGKFSSGKIWNCVYFGGISKRPQIHCWHERKAINHSVRDVWDTYYR